LIGFFVLFGVVFCPREGEDYLATSKESDRHKQGVRSRRTLSVILVNTDISKVLEAGELYLSSW
jgi:hypothetical protein